MEITQGTMTLDRDEALALAAHASTDETRPHMCAVWVEPELLRAWSTDGHRAIMGRPLYPTAYVGPRAAAAGILASDLKHAARLLRKGDRLAIILSPGAGDGQTVALGTGARLVGLVATDEAGNAGPAHWVRPVAEDPVRIDNVIPYLDTESPATPAVSLNPRLLADACRVSRAAGGQSYVTIYPGATPLDPVTVRATGASAVWTAVVMPMRGEDVTVTHDGAIQWAAAIVAHDRGLPVDYVARAMVEGITGPAPVSGEVSPAPSPPALQPKRRRRRKKGGEAQAA